MQGAWDRRTWLGLVTALVALAILLLREIGNPSIAYPDADRFLMDGVFILDFLRDRPFTRIYDYTIHYYAQYPALSIGYHPPFFPFVEALFNGVFGVNGWSSRLAVLAFMMVGVTAWYAIVTRAFDWLTAFASSLLWISVPFVTQWGWYTMSDLPLLAMMLASAALFYRYTRSARPRDLYWAAIVFGMAAWTKQTAVVLGVWFLMYLLVTGNLRAYLKRREVWWGMGIVVAMLVPLALITLWLGKANIAQSVGTTADAHMPSRLAWSSLRFYPNALLESQLTMPMLVLSALGLVIAIWKRDRRVWFFVTLIISCYLFFTALMAKEARYVLAWIPGFCLLAALPLFYWRHQAGLRWGYGIVLGVIVASQVNTTYARVPHYATGYDEAAKFVVTHSRSPTVFFDGINNGYFIYFMRQLDPKREMYVLRGDKILSSSAISARTWLTVHAHTPQDIQAKIDEYGIEYIVVEQESRFEVPIHQTLREHLQSGAFKLVKTIPVKSNRAVLKGQNLLIYQYRHPKTPTSGSLALDLPVVGKTLTVPIRNLGAR